MINIPNTDKAPSVQLSLAAWKVRAMAQARKTKVGCALLGLDGKIHTGCNIEHDFCHSVHAEEVAIFKMISKGCRQFDVLLVAAEMRAFTPCGSCMDWIMHACLSREETLIGFQSAPGADISWTTPQILMPLYPAK